MYNRVRNNWSRSAHVVFVPDAKEPEAGSRRIRLEARVMSVMKISKTSIRVAVFLKTYSMLEELRSEPAHVLRLPYV